MIKTFTQTDLIRYLYREITEEEKKEIESALKRDSNLKELFCELRAGVKDLDQVLMEPSSRTIDSILSYSKGLKVRP